MISTTTLNVSSVSFSQSKQFSPILIDYLNGDEKLKSFYKYAPKIDAFAEVIENKKKQIIDRNTLVKVLNEQYAHAAIKPTVEVQKNIDSLLNENTFTITTGHQLALFTGPLYFIYKIVTTINTAKQLKEKYPSTNFVPVFWLASEDHDLEEINHVNLFGKILSCDLGKGSPAGLVSTKLVEPMLAELKTILGESENANYLYNLFQTAYTKQSNLSDATKYIVHELFKNDGIVIIDGNYKELKKQFTSVIKDELKNQSAFKIVSEINKELEKNYKIQASPRNINLFFIDPSQPPRRGGDVSRKRIVSREESTEKENTISVTEVIALVDTFPEQFSPNVLLRPLYQESILPNLAYIGGPAEVAYWLELKNLFKYHNIPFPVVMMRNSAMFLDEKSSRFKVESSKWFNPIDELINEYVTENSAVEISFVKEYEQLKLFYADLEKKISQIDSTLSQSVKAESAKHIADLEKLEQKLIKAEKRKHETAINQIKSIKEKLFPNGVMQERHENFMPLYLKYGNNFFKLLNENFDSFNSAINIFM